MYNLLKERAISCSEIVYNLTTHTVLDKVEVGGLVIHFFLHAQLGLASSSIDRKM
jgi:hypothetical protein